MPDVIIAGARRTPIGGFQGELSALTVPQLGSAAIAAAVDDASIAPETIDETMMGLVLPAGIGQAPARQASLGAGLSHKTPATTVSKVCGSGMQAIINGCNLIEAAHASAVVAGGMESMSNAPYLLPAMRNGARLGHATLIDHMFRDGLEDAYDEGRLMGSFAEMCAAKYGFSRQQQDEYAIASLVRAVSADQGGCLVNEVCTISVPARAGEQMVVRDEQPGRSRADKIPKLKPAFQEDGTITAANASSISDGAAALVLVDRPTQDRNDLPCRARIAGYAGFAQEPAWFTTAPVFAARKLMEQTGWSSKDVDLWEVNEAFAVVAMAFMREMDIGHDRMNIHGGACAIGHPIGASGARIVVTLLNALEVHGLKRGIAAICIGGGEALAIAIERE